MTSSAGTSQTAYGFTGEQYSADTQMLYLRARYYNPADGRFQSRDTWSGDVKRPMSMNRWNYTDANPINRTDHSGKCWYGDIATGEIKVDPFLEGSGPCSFFVNAMETIGITVTTPDEWLNSLPENIRNQIICDDATTLTSGPGFWIVIKYSTSSPWTFYSTGVNAINVKFGVGIRGVGGYSCDSNTQECDFTFGIEAGTALLSVGLAGDYNVADSSYTMGATLTAGPCSGYFNYAKISITCGIPVAEVAEGALGENDSLETQVEFGWIRNPYEAYYVLAHTSQIMAAGGEDEFGKQVITSRIHPDLPLHYEIMDTSSDPMALGALYFKRGIRLIRAN